MLAERSVYVQVKACIDGKDCSMMQSAYVDCTKTCVLKFNGKRYWQQVATGTDGFTSVGLQMLG